MSRRRILSISSVRFLQISVLLMYVVDVKCAVAWCRKGQQSVDFYGFLSCELCPAGKYKHWEGSIVDGCLAYNSGNICLYCWECPAGTSSSIEGSQSQSNCVSVNTSAPTTTPSTPAPTTTLSTQTAAPATSGGHMRELATRLPLLVLALIASYVCG